MLDVVLTGLPTGVTLANRSGYTAAGDPYILVNLANSTLAPGQTLHITVLFVNPKHLSFASYGIMVLDNA